MSQSVAPEYFDVLIVGAGLSGIGAAYQLQRRCPGKTYAILEARAQSGGTWDLFRYPGIRSDSDMYTLGYSFRPWRGTEAIASGNAILSYVRKTARENDIDRHIRFNHRVTAASWSSADASWTVEVSGPKGATQRLRCNFLYMCSGYYDYAQGYTPDFPGVSDFAGQVVHPQHWTPDIDYAGKRVVVIGSGATAVTLVPELAKTAAHVTMLQRSPTYVIARPSIDRLAVGLRRLLPDRVAYLLSRWKNVLLGMLFFQLCKRRPELMKRLLLGGVQRELGPNYDVEKHFTPRYNPWDQRLCLVPNGDLFAAIRAGRASVVTDHIQRFVADGIELQSGEKLDADLVVTATGLIMRVGGGAKLTVDGKSIDPARALTYKGMMLSDVPNMAIAGGYTNASWTLKCDLTAEYVCRMLEHMRERSLRQCTARNRDPSVQPQDAIDFSSGYVQRALPILPKQGNKAPWRLHQNYVRDMLMLRHGLVSDGVMVFSNPIPRHAPATISSLPPARYDHAERYDRPSP